MAVSELEGTKTGADTEYITQNSREGSENVMSQRRERGTETWKFLIGHQVLLLP